MPADVGGEDAGDGSSVAWRADRQPPGLRAAVGRGGPADPQRAAAEPSPYPLGVKGLGESGAIAVPTVIANAVADALAPLGVRHLDPLQVGAAVAGAGPVALRSGQRWRASSASVPTVFQFLVLAATLSFRSRKALFSLVLP
jgi:hypothetical protein